MTGRVAATVLLAALAAAIPAGAATAVGDSLEIFGADLLSEPLSAVVRGDRAYALYPSGLVALDISSPLEVRELWSEYLPGAGGDLVARDTLLYVTRGDAGLFTLSVADDAAAVFLDTIGAPSILGRLATGWNRLYAADRDSGLIVYDVRTPIPDRLARYETGEEIRDLVIDGGVAYLAFERSGARLVDISFFVPSLISEIDEFEGALRLDAGGDRLYAALPDSMIRVADVSDSAAPGILPDLFDGGGPVGPVLLLDSLLVAVRDGNELLILRADSLGGGALGVDSGEGAITDLVPADGGILAASDEGGIRFYDLVVPQSATFISTISFDGVAVSGLAVEGDRAYLTAGAKGVFLVSLADEVEPDSLGHIETVAAVNAVVIDDSVLYAAESGGLRTYDISRRALLGSLSLEGSSQQVLRNGDYAYVCGGASGLFVVDVSDPASPALVDSIPNGGVGNRLTRDLALRGDLLVIAEGDAGLRFADVSDPSNPTVVGSYDPSDYAVDAAFSDAGYLYVSLRSTGLLVIDAADPASPDSVGMLELPEALFLLHPAAIGNVLYLTESAGFGLPGKIHLVSLADPLRPGLIRTLEASGSPSRVVTGTDRAYVAAGLGGLEIYGYFEDYGFFRTWSHDPHSRIEAVAASEGLIAVADDEGRVWSLYLGEGEVLARGESYDLGTPVADLAAVGSVIYASLPEAGQIARFRIPSPGTLILDYRADVSGAPDGLAVDDSVLYAGLRSGGLGLYDARPSDALVSFGTFTSGGGFDLAASSAERVFVDSGSAYVTTNDVGRSLYILDVSDPSAPAALGTYETSFRPLDVAARSGYVYLALRIDGLHVVDARDPANPSLVIIRNDFLPTLGLEITGEVLFASRRDAGVGVYSVANPSGPVEIWSEPTPTAANDASVFGTYVALSDRSAFRIYRQGFANADTQGPGYAIGILPNAFANAFVDFVVVASEALIEKPTIRFSMGDVDSSLTVYRVDTPRNVYHSTYRLTETGIGSVTVDGEDLAGNKTQTNKNFAVSFVRGSRGGSIYDESGKVAIGVAPREGVEEEAVLLTPEAEDPGSDVPRAIHGPFRLHLGRLEGTAELTVSDLEAEEEDGSPGVYRKEGDRWVPVDALYDPETRVLEAHLPGSTLFLVSGTGEATAPPAPPLLLEPNRPNPFNPTTTVRFRLAEEGRARVAVYDLAGRLVRDLADRVFPAGPSELVWNGVNGSGREASSGVYFVRLEAADRTLSRKVLLLR